MIKGKGFHNRRSPVSTGPIPPSGYTFLRGQMSAGSYSILRGQTSPGVYVNLAGK